MDINILFLIKKLKNNINKEVILDEVETRQIINGLKVWEAYGEVLDETLKEQLEELKNGEEK